MRSRADDSPPRGWVAVPAGRWTVDPERSTVGFTVRHMVVSAVRGGFAVFDGHVDADASGPRAAGAVRVATLDTGNALRDEHLLGARYFDAAHHPEIRFASTAIEPLDDTSLRIAGDLTVKGSAHAIELHARPTRIDHRIELAVSGTVNRRVLGIDSSELLDAGVGDRVTLEMRLTLVRA